MKTKTKIRIDKLVGTPLVYSINALARFLGFILRIDHALDKPFDTIVISKYVGLGSIIQATPLIQTLRQNFPRAKIIFITTSGGRVLLSHIPEIDETLCVSDKNLRQVISTSTKLLLRLWQVRPQLFIDLEFYSNYSSIITTLSMSKNRLGFFKEDRAYRKGVYNYLIPFSVDFPISKTYLQFAELIKCKNLITSLKIELNEGNHWQGIAKKIAVTQSDAYVVINPNASDLRLERRWPKASFIQVINSFLARNNRYKVVLVGDKSEMAYVSELEKELNNKEVIINSAGQLNFSELIVLIAGARWMLTNDTGPMHVAFAVKTKTISLFGPCSPLQYGGSENAITFYKKVHCSPCVHKYIIPPCHGDNQCMKQISVEEVSESIKRYA